MKKPLSIISWACIGLASCLVEAQTCSAADPLAYQGDLKYLGAFRVPQLGSAGDQNSFNYGGTSLSFNAANNSLFIVGYDPQQALAEVAIPAIGSGASINGLPAATLLQGFKDPTEGRLGSINPSDPNSKKIGGSFAYGGKLYLSGYSYYDGAGTQATSEFVRPLNLSTTGQVQGPYRVGNQYPGFVSGYMTQIPSAWQSQFGGPALIGNCCLAIAGVQSNGPAASVFDPKNVGSLDPVPATPVVGYPSDHPLGTGWGTTNSLYNGTTHIRGIVFPVGTRSVLFFGRHGVGTFCYGPGAECNDPADGSKGVHAYPYKHQIWAYDANDLVAVKNGTKAQWAVQPYVVWNFSLPYDDPASAMDIGGAAYDPQSGRIYVSQLCTDWSTTSTCGPVIHVYQVGTGSTNSTPPATPTNLQLH